MKTLTPEEFKKLYGEKTTSLFTPTQTPKAGVVSRVASDIPSDVAETAKDVGGTFRDLSNRVGQTTRGVRGFGQTLGLTAGAVAKVGGQILTGAGKSVLTPEAEQSVKTGVEKTVAPVVKKALENPYVQNFLKDYESLSEQDKLDVDALFGVGSLATELATLGVGGRVAGVAKEGVEIAGQQALKTGIKVGQSALETASPVLSTAKDVGKGALTLGQSALETASRIPTRIGANVAEKQTAREIIQSLPTKTARKTALDGVDVGDVKTVLNIPKTQKPAIQKLVKGVQDYSKGLTKTRPEEIVGKPFVTALKRLDNQKQSIGKKLGEVAKDLGSVTSKEVFPEVFNELKRVGGLSGLNVSKKGILDFTNTTLATSLTKSDRQAIQRIFTDAIKSGSGASKHRLRQELFESLGGAKKGGAILTDTQEKAFEAVRKGLSNILDGKNPMYKELSKKYAENIRPLQDLRKFFKGVEGADEDILDMAGGLLARRLTSNAPSNPQLRNILRNIDKVLKQKGKTLTSLENLQDMYNVLDKYYDIAAKTGFQGQVKAGVEKVGGVTEKILGPVLELTGETPAVRQAALEKLLKELFD